MSYDVIVIGSGAGGLSAALPLAQAGKRVLVLEQHEVPGGYTQSFTLSGYQFSPGVHYIGQLGPDGSMRAIYEGLGVSVDLEFCEMNPDGYDHIFIGEERFDFPAGEERLIAALQERFPEEAQGIEAYIRTTREIMEALSSMRKVRSPGDVWTAARAAALVARWAPRTGMDLIEAHVSDPVLQGVLSGQAGDHGLPPSKASAIVHAAITHHYLDGAWYPRGGGFAIPRAFVRALKRAGGEIRLNTRVERILLDGQGRVAGVGLDDASEVHAPVVVSNADPHVTLEQLIGREHLDWRTRRKLDQATYSVSALSLFFAVDMDLRSMGLDSGNYWYYAHEDVDGIYEAGLGDTVLEEDVIEGMFLAAPTLKDPSKMHDGHHTCEAFAFVNYEAFERWAHEPHRDHSQGYEALKEALTEKMFATLEERIPGLRDHVVYHELATPLTNEHYVNVTKGNLYGLAKTRGQLGPGAFPVESRVPGLYMVGASTLSHGVAGATMSGLAAASTILSCRVRDLLDQDGPSLRVYPSEHPEAWPEELQTRIKRGQ
ncbi:MAG: NAD(P)/FAD-dependent oxidoreductase, partial [Candidatus Thermoplasmatota archaeon]|nr:NAD(P)/FAD-dependent oxidoreductase [Candidatus Thermoplasmatota archaeon]